MTTTAQIVNRTLSSKTESKRLVDLLAVQEDNAEWIASNFGGLAKQYADKYIAVKNRSVVDSDKNIIHLIGKLKKKYDDLDDFVIQYMTEKPIIFLL
ncbi:MAG: DUF5678 domain-containing protein [Promethearchaeati archaeon SRVP18_Atabeyarchaeia-1]